MSQRLVIIQVGPVAAAVANNIALAQTLAGAGNLILNGALVAGGVATLDVPRRVGITAVADETAKTFTVTGTDRFGCTISEVLVGPGVGLTVATTKDYKTVTNIAGSAALAGNVTVGTTQTVSSQWVPIDRTDVYNLGVSVQVGAVVPTYSVEYTLDDPFSPGVGVNPVTDFYLKPYPLTALDAKNTSLASAFVTPITAVRLTLTAFAANASAKATFAPGPVEDR
jgi:hypothetical protein